MTNKLQTQSNSQSKNDSVINISLAQKNPFENVCVGLWNKINHMTKLYSEASRQNFNTVSIGHYFELVNNNLTKIKEGCAQIADIINDISVPPAHDTNTKCSHLVKILKSPTVPIEHLC